MTGETTPHGDGLFTEPTSLFHPNPSQAEQWQCGVQVRKSIEHVIAIWKRDPAGDRVSRSEPQAALPQPSARASRFSAQPPAGQPSGGLNASHIKVVSYMPVQQPLQAQQASWQQQEQPPLPPQQQMQQPGLEAWMQQQTQAQQQYNQQQIQQPQPAPQMAPWEQQAMQQQPWAPAPANGYPPKPPQPLPPPPQQPVPVHLAVTSVLRLQLKDRTCPIMLLLTY